jgi:phosphoribosylanthranilate isomerase
VIRATGAAKLVGIFVNPEPDDVLAVLGRVELDIIQLHGDEDLEHVREIAKAVYRPVWKAIAVKSARDLEHLDQWPVDALLLDAPTAGAGATFDHALARTARAQFPQLKIILAGGLAPDNVATAIANVKPWAVDVASGVEAGPGVKDRTKLAAFIAAVQGASA